MSFPRLPKHVIPAPSDNVVINDMEKIDYPIHKVDVELAKYLPDFGLNVQEAELDDITDQMEMLQGMFRSLSLLVQLNYSLWAEIPSCILIDDIGEGLDYERSKGLIDLIIDKVKNSPVQMIMATNDQFVMDKIPLEYWSVVQRIRNKFVMDKTPLEYWSVVQRIRNKSVFYNYTNAKQAFDDFVFTGLNNFDFFATEFYAHGFEDYVKEKNMLFKSLSVRCIMFILCGMMAHFIFANNVFCQSFDCRKAKTGVEKMMTMKFGNDKLSVTQEGGCGFGMNVSAEGDYVRKSKGAPGFSDDIANQFPEPFPSGIS